MLYSKAVYVIFKGRYISHYSFAFSAFVFVGEYNILQIFKKEKDGYRRINSGHCYGILQFCLPGLYFFVCPKIYHTYMGDKLPLNISIFPRYLAI